ncbi:MAG TPA: NADP-dependent oxidoreductase [Candidatus Dormibacteraeota bacterium]|nr:NADP-dependent oxidoreductase [Candidatus Dormibacteraeota bacterium]
MNRRGLEVRVAARPDPDLTPDCFEIVEVEVPQPGEGELLVRNDWMALSAVMGNLMGIGAELPMPRYRLGEALWGAAVGTVLRSRSFRFSPGDLVRHRRGWREYALGEDTEFTRVDRRLLPGPEYHLSQGPTAWRGMAEIAGVRPEDTVFVSGAAGGVGSLAGQIARRLGAGRVIGSAGSPAKIHFLLDELGYDAALDHHDGPIVDRLRQLAPAGIDVFFDNVGGEQFEAAVEVAARGARFALCGALAGQIGGGDGGRPRLDLIAAGSKELVLRAFMTRPGEDWDARFAAWLREGSVVFPHATVSGLAAAPRALIDLRGGSFAGGVLVRLSDEAAG